MDSQVFVVIGYMFLAYAAMGIAMWKWQDKAIAMIGLIFAALLIWAWTDPAATVAWLRLVFRAEVVNHG